MRKNSVPFALALQGIGFSVIVLLVFSDLVLRNGHEAIPSGLEFTSSTSGQQVLNPEEIPLDLERERLRFPRQLERKDPKNLSPSSSETVWSPEPMADELKLAGLRVQSIALTSVMSVNISTPLLNGPDSTEGMSIAGVGRSWLSGRSKSRSRRG